MNVYERVLIEEDYDEELIERMRESINVVGRAKEEIVAS